MENMEESLNNIVKNDQGEVVGEHFGLEDKDLQLEQSDLEQMSEMELNEKITELNNRIFHLKPEEEPKREGLVEQVNKLEEELARKESTTANAA